MKPTNLLRRVWALPLLALAATMFAPAPATAQTVPTAQVLPDDVYLYFSVPSVQELKARWDKTSFGRIAADPAFEDFNNELQELMEKATREFEQQTEMKLPDLLDVPTGEVSFAVTKPPQGQVAVTGFVDFGKSEDVVDQLLARLEDAMDDQNADRKVQEFKNTRIVVYKLPAAGQEQGPIKPGFSYFVKDNQFVVSNEVSALEAVLTNWGGQARDTFANNRIFEQIMQKCKTGNEKPVFQWFFDPVGSLKAAVSAFGGDNPQAAMVMNLFLPLSGLNDFRGMGGTADWATKDYEGLSKTMLYVNQPPQGLLNLFLFPPADLTPPKWVSQEAQAYVAANWDVEAAYDAVESMVDQFRGAGTLEGVIEDIANRPDGPGIHLKKDVFDQLSGRFYMINQGVESLEQNVPKFLVSVGIEDTKTVQDLFAKVIKNQNAPVKTRDFRGETIMEFSNGPATVAVSVFNNAVMVTSNVSLLEQIIRGDRTKKPLVDSAAYRQITDAIPEKTSIFSFQDSDAQMKVLYEAARKGQFGEAEIPPEAQNLFKTLPPFEALKKYLPVSASYTIPDENGVLSVNLSQMKDKE